MSSDINVADGIDKRIITLPENVKIKSATWLDTGKPVKLIDKNSFKPELFYYGTSMFARVAKIKI